MKCIVGLGNPGSKYKETRHNIGFSMIDQFVSSHDGSWSYNNSFGAEIADLHIDGIKVLCVKPQLYMNLSGGPIQSIISYYDCDIDDLLVLHDEIDLANGIVQYKIGGSAAGHNGLKDIIAKIGSKDFGRIRIGVGRPEKGSALSVSDYVLGRFSDAEISVINEKYDAIAKIIYQFIV